MINDKIYKYISISGAFIIWGFWAFYINPGSWESRLLSAICQAVLSATATALMITSIKWFLKYFKNIFIAPLIVTSLTTACGLSVHFLIGTAEIIATLAPALTVALIFSLITSYNLSRNSVRESF